MGRFLNRHLSAANSPLWHGAPKKSAAVPGTAAAVEAPAEVGPVVAAAPVVRPTPIQVVGLICLSIYLISGWATDFSFRFFGGKPYLSLVTGIMALVCFIISGKALTALRTSVGRLWLALGIWMILSVVFSRWRGGSFELLKAYFPKYHMIPLYMAAFVVTVSNCRTLLRACAVGGFVMLLECVFFGSAEEDGRFAISSNTLLSNPNDMAMQLLLALGFFLFWIRQPNRVGRALGIVGMISAFYFLPRTGSRGGIISGVVMVGLWILLRRDRARVIMAAVLIGAVVVAVTPHNMLQRLVTFGANEQGADSEDREKAVESRLEREHLLRAAIGYTLRYPLFGIGPGEFADAIWEDGKKEGRHEASLGPHNTYAQIGAECGIPGLIMFTLAIVGTIRSSYRLYRATAETEGQALVAAASYSCFMLTVALAIDLFFHHMAYSGSSIAIIIGLWVSLENVAKLAGIQVSRPAPEPLMVSAGTVHPTALQ